MQSVLTTICKANLNIADIDRKYYKSHSLTLAQRSTETTRKSMMRIVAYIYNANETLIIRKKHWYFDQPELIEQSFDSKIKLWIDLGEPNIKRVKKACKLSNDVIIYTYNKQKTNDWWQRNQPKLSEFKNLSIYNINANELVKLNGKRMTLSCILQDGDLQIHDGRHNLLIERKKLM